MGELTHYIHTLSFFFVGLIKRPSSKRNSFPRLKSRRWTSTASSSSDYSELEEKTEEKLEVLDTMSSDPEKNKQSIMLNRECELSGGVMASQLVTLGTGPSPSS